ncbi:MAG: hypothetical protein RSG77_21545 [Hafnia sp.]
METSKAASRTSISIKSASALRDQIYVIAEREGESFNDASQRLIMSGYKAFWDKIETQSPQLVLSIYRSSAKALGENSMTDWVIETDRRTVNKVRLTAHEYDQTTNEFVVGILLESLGMLTDQK